MTFDMQADLDALLAQHRDRPTPLTDYQIRALTIQFVLDHVEGTERAEVEAEYDRIYMGGRR